MQTPFGKGIVREMRRGRLVVEINGRPVVFAESDVAPVDAKRPSKRERPPAAEPETADARGSREVDLHGLTVDDALARAEQALNDALLADVSELRVIHGKSGGRIRAALHRRLREIQAVRAFRIDPRNPGITIVSL